MVAPPPPPPCLLSEGDLQDGLLSESVQLVQLRQGQHRHGLVSEGEQQFGLLSEGGTAVISDKKDDVGDSLSHDPSREEELRHGL